MRRILLLFAFCWVGHFAAFAQIPNGSTAPNFTVTDINGNVISLYSLLDQGKTVYLDVFATWCVPCWNYHNSHALRDIWEQYGPPGTDEAYVISIEGDATTSIPCIWDDPGCTGGTVGDWTDGTPYPIADYPSIMGLYQVTYYPTIFMICPADKKVYEVGQQPASGLWASRSNLCPPLEVTASIDGVTNTKCFGSSTGAINISVSGGTAPYTYSWSNGATTQDLNNIPSGMYSCTITNAQGWLGETGPIMVEDAPAPLDLTLAGTTPVGCSGIYGSIIVEGSGGWSNLSYHWNNGMIGEEASPLLQGTYICTVTDGSGCSKTLTTTLAPPVYPSVTIDPPGAISCTSPTIQLEASATGGYSGYYDFEWFASNGGNIVSGGTTNMPTVNAAGSYTAQVTDVDTYCSGFATIIVSSTIDPPSAEAGPTMEITCAQSTAVLDGSGATGTNISIAWQAINGGSIVSGGDTYTPTVEGTGDYVLVVTNSTNGCVKMDTTSVAGNTVPPSTSATGGALTCVTTQVELEATTDAGNPGFSWSGPNGYSSSMQNPTVEESGEYTLIVTDSTTGCTNSATAEVATNTSLPGATASGGTLTCTTTSIELNGASALPTAEFAWTGPNGFSSDIATPNVAETGTYDLVVTDPANGCTSTASTAVDQNTTPPAASAETPGNLNCNTTQVVLDGSASAQGSAITYLWTTIDGNIVSGAETTSPTVDAIGDYALLVTDTENGCTSTASTAVAQSTAVTAEIDNSTNVSCNGLANGTATAAGGGGNASYTYEWNNGETTAQVTSLAAGTYTVIITDGESCSATVSVVITEPAVLAPNVTATAETAQGANDGTATAGPNGGTAGYTYLWNTGEIEQTISNLAPGTYTATITDANGCTAVQSAVVNAFNCTISATVSNTNVTCNGANDGTATVSLTGANDPVTYTWNNGEATAEVINLTPGTYTVEVVDNTNCAAIMEVTITQPELLEANAVATGETSAGANDGTAVANPMGGSMGYTYAWSTGETTQNIENLAPGAYTVIVTDANGCSDEQTVVVNAFNCAISAEPTIVNASCPGSADGSIMLALSNGTEPYTYAWNNGGNAELIENLAAGTYTASVTDANGCVFTETYEVIDVDNVAPQIEAQNTSLALNASGSATATMQSLNATVSDNCTSAIVEISPNAFDCSDLGEQVITITATDEAGNTSSTTVVVTIEDNLPPTVDCPSDIVACWNENTVSYDAPVAQDNCLINGGTWNLEEGLPSGSTFPVGETKQVYTFTDANGNVGSCNFIVGITEPIVLNGTTVQPDVNNQGVGSIHLDISGGNQPLTFIWTNAEGVIISDSKDLEGLVAGIYFVEIVDASGCKLTDVEGIVVGNTSGTNEPAWLSGVSIRPNPTSGVAQIFFANMPDVSFEISVVDITGRVLSTQNVDRQYVVRLDCADLPDGVYLVRFHSGSEFGVRKLMIGR
ncbi:MAG: T9SS type A sorting domain-containing protein [Lewinellaceae bacterium]|nr:T9SS type A sorting domain-containing protein [Saprospiraceae bacterium]MCB9330448.1 T9SS type A sorting domain-containing protein [Lewinellaceae bacterium]